MIRQGRPLQDVLYALCQFFAATFRGYTSMVFLLDRAGATVEDAIGPGLDIHSEALFQNCAVSEVESLRLAGLTLCQATPIQTLTGETLAIFAVYQREGCLTPCVGLPTTIERFSQIAGYTIERFCYERELKRSTALRLTEAERLASLAVLSAAIAHEVNQPLSGIVTNADTCRRMLSSDPPNIEGALETARRTIRDAERACEVIKRVRTLFGGNHSSCELLNLNDAIREVIALSQDQLRRNQVVVRTEFVADLPEIHGDRVQLQQVILNLLSNASQAMLNIDDRPRVLVLTTAREDDRFIRVSVQDNGPGIAPGHIARLFEAFYTTKTDGMGMGLCISQSIIERHRGRLWVAANVGHGVTFSFAIPLHCKSA